MKLRGGVAEIFTYMAVLRNMVLSQFKAKYSGSVLGISWALINPIALALVITFIFKVVFKAGQENFQLFVLSGILPWMFFSCAITESSFSIINYRSMLRQFNFPRWILPASSILSNFLNFLIGLAVMLPFFLAITPKAIFFLPFLFLFLLLNLIFVLGLGFILSIFNVFLRDIGHLIPIVLMLWLWVTPVFYSIDMIPEGWRWIFNFNPMAAYIACFRDAIFYARFPQLSALSYSFLWAFFSFISGIFLFASLENRILKVGLT
jgi:ABC-2 type transport system permease protein